MRFYIKGHCILCVTAVTSTVTVAWLQEALEILFFSLWDCVEAAAQLFLVPEEQPDQKYLLANPKHLCFYKFYFVVVPSEVDYEIIP